MKILRDSILTFDKRIEEDVEGIIGVMDLRHSTVLTERLFSEPSQDRQLPKTDADIRRNSNQKFDTVTDASIK
jgi:hypothetical protein